MRYYAAEQQAWVHNLAEKMRLPRLRADESDFWPRPAGPSAKPSQQERTVKVELIPIPSPEVAIEPTESLAARAVTVLDDADAE